MSKRGPHICYHCSCTIITGQTEKRVEGLRVNEIRYQHDTEQGCRDAVERQIGYGTQYNTNPEEDTESLYSGRKD
jgi:hypothetical protein